MTSPDRNVESDMLPLRTVSLDDITTVNKFSHLLDVGRDGEMKKFLHEESITTDATPSYLTGNIPYFGNGIIPSISSNINGRYKTSPSATIVVPDAVFYPRSSLIVDRFGQVPSANFRYIPQWGDINTVDSNVTRIGDIYHVDASPFKGPPSDETQDVIICGSTIASNNYGHFLFDGLALCMLQANHIDLRPAKLFFPPLTRWQREILELLGLLEFVSEIEKPIYSRRIITNSQVSGAVFAPSRFCRTVFDTLKFIVGSDDSASELVYLRRSPDAKRGLRNQATMEQLLEAKGFRIVEPDRLSVREQILSLSRARLIVGQAGAGMANACFAPVGASILEIMPDKYPDVWMRHASRQIGLNWHLFVCEVQEEDIRYNVNPLWPNATHFTFDVPLDLLEEAITTVSKFRGF